MRVVSPRIFFICTATIVIASVLSISFYAFVARASVYNLYASTCLGGWENTHLASGDPEGTEVGEAPVFTEVNSARLDGSVHAQIYCGGFSGDILENTVPKKILVRFSWAVEYPKLDSAALQIKDATTTTDSIEQLENEDIDVTDISNPPDGESSVEPEAVEPEAMGSGEPQTPATIEPTTESETETAPVTEESVLQLQETAPEPSSEPTPQEPAASILNFFATAAYAQEIVGTASTTIDSTFETATTTPDIATSTPASAYGLVEVLYTLDGVEWRSLGFVEKDEFGNKHFEIPIEEASDWEDISKIQIGIQSVPVVDGVAPIIYLDSVWIETEYEYANQNDTSQLASVASAIGEVLGETIGELIPAEEPEIIEEVPVEEVSVEETFQPIIEPAPLPPRLSSRDFSKDIVIDPNATHSCEAEPFSIDVSGRDVFFTKITLKKMPEEKYEMEIGSLPDGIDVRFNNDDYFFQPDSDGDIISLQILNEEGSRTGNFTIPVIFSEKSNQDSSVICQINIINQ